MGETHLSIVVLATFIMLVGPVASSTSLHDINEEHSQKTDLLQNIAKSVRHVVRMRPTTNMPYHCGLVFSPANGTSLTMMSMLRLTDKSLVIINTKPNSEGNFIVPTCQSCHALDNLVVFGSAADIPEVISRVNSNCTAARIELLVAIYDVLDSEQEAEKLAKNVVDFAWNQIRGFATVLIPVGNRILILKSERHVPFVRCEPEPPRMVSYLENGSFVGNLPFGNFGYNKCVIRGASSNCWLLARLVDETDNETTAIGVEIDIMKTIAEQQNFTLQVVPVFSVVETQETISNTSRVRSAVLSGTADIGACNMWVWLRKGLRFTASYSSNTVVLMIPIPKYIPFTSILNTFSGPVWICIGVSWIVGRMLIRMNGRSISSLMALALFLGVSVESESRGFMENLQMMLWVIYGYLITQSYIGSLASVLNNPKVERIETFGDLAASDLRVLGYPSQKEFFLVDPRYKRIFDTFLIVIEPYHTEMMLNPDKLIPERERTGILIDILLMDQSPWFSGYYRLRERVSNFPLGMAVSTRSRLYLGDVDRTILTLVESGVVDKWVDEARLPPGTQRVSSDWGTQSPTLSLGEVAGIFVILVVGLLLSIIVFITEVSRKKKSENNSQPKSPEIESN